MKITKIFNNNAVATVAANKTEFILTGSGIGFQKKIGELVDEKRIERKYVFDGSENSSVYRLFLNTPNDYFELAQQIFDRASSVLRIEVKDKMIFALVDHISFAIERYENNVDLPNLVLSEIKTLYKTEYQIGLWSLKLIEDTLNVKLNEDEAGYIALHIINGTSSDAAKNTMDILEIVDGCLDIIQQEFNLTYDDEDLNYIRLTTHLKFMAQRIISGSSDDEEFENEDMLMVFSKNKSVVKCVNVISEYLKREFKYKLDKKEELYLMIHLTKFCK